VAQPKYFVLNVDPKNKDVIDEVNLLMAIIASETEKVCKAITNIFDSNVKVDLRHFGFIAKFKSQYELMVSTSTKFSEHREEIIELLYGFISRGSKNTNQKEERSDPKELTNDLVQALRKICDKDVDVQFVEAVEKCLTTIWRHLDNHSTITVNTYRLWNKYIPPTDRGSVELLTPTEGEEEIGDNNTHVSEQEGLFGTEDIDTSPSPDEQLVDGSGHNTPLNEEGKTDGTESQTGGHDINVPAQQNEMLELELVPNYSARHGKLQIGFLRDGFTTSIAMSKTFADQLSDLVRARLAGKIQVEVNPNALGQMEARSLAEK